MDLKAKHWWHDKQIYVYSMFKQQMKTSEHAWESSLDLLKLIMNRHYNNQYNTQYGKYDA